MNIEIKQETLHKKISETTVTINEYIDTKEIRNMYINETHKEAKDLFDLGDWDCVEYNNCNTYSFNFDEKKEENITLFMLYYDSVYDSGYDRLYRYIQEKDVYVTNTHSNIRPRINYPYYDVKIEAGDYSSLHETSSCNRTKKIKM